MSLVGTVAIMGVALAYLAGMALVIGIADGPFWMIVAIESILVGLIDMLMEPSSKG